MKYRVVGWTDYDNCEVEDSGNCIGFAERNAIIDDIKKNGYLFSGWDHQEMWTCTPVLNDGKKRTFSQRGWGGVMAEAYERTEDFDYACFTFHGSLDKDKCVYPRDEFSPEDFTPETALNEHFDIEVKEEIFNLAQEKNPFFLDVLDELRFIDAGDTLTLHCGEKIASFPVSDIDRCHSTNGKGTAYTINTEHKIIVIHKR